METKAWLIEEIGPNKEIVWKMISFFEPDSLEWMRDLKGKRHNLIITKLIAGESKTINGVEKKYDSSKFVVGL